MMRAHRFREFAHPLTRGPLGAQRGCAGCPVKRECLEFALATKARGIWGGTTEQQRQSMQGRRGGLPDATPERALGPGGY